MSAGRAATLASRMVARTADLATSVETGRHRREHRSRRHRRRARARREADDLVELPQRLDEQAAAQSWRLPMPMATSTWGTPARSAAASDPNSHGSRSTTSGRHLSTTSFTRGNAARASSRPKMSRITVRLASSIDSDGSRPKTAPDDLRRHVVEGSVGQTGTPARDRRTTRERRRAPRDRPRRTPARPGSSGRSDPCRPSSRRAPASAQSPIGWAHTGAFLLFRGPAASSGPFVRWDFAVPARLAAQGRTIVPSGNRPRQELK